MYVVYYLFLTVGSIYSKSVETSTHSAAELGLQDLKPNFCGQCPVYVRCCVTADFERGLEINIK